MGDGLVRDEDGRARCWWCAATPEYRAYHDREWGFPVADDRRLLEKLILEGFQSGLSWLTILRKRESFRRAFAGFDVRAVARFDATDVARLLADTGIVRHRGKIESAINNARRAGGLADECGSLAAYFWRFEPRGHASVATRAQAQARTTVPEAVAMAKDLKRRGWTFVGPTTAYAFMQAMGMVDDHLEGCAVREEVERARAAFVRPRW